MPSRKLTDINLNLLVALDILLEEQNVTKAGERLNITQSAMSSILKQLRQVFDDPLFVRSQSSKMLPTNFALSLKKPLAEFLEKAEKVLYTEPEFNPATCTKAFRIGMTEQASLILLPKIVSYCQEHAPNIDLQVQLMRNITDVEPFEQNELELALGVFDELPLNMKSERLFSAKMVIIGRSDNPILDQPIDMKTFAKHPQVSALTISEKKLKLDEILSKNGLSRNIVVTVHQIMSGLFTVYHSKTQLLGIFPEKLLDVVMGRTELKKQPLSFVDAKHEVIQAWHLKTDSDPCSAWLRTAIKNVCSE